MLCNGFRNAKLRKINEINKEFFKFLNFVLQFSLEENFIQLLKGCFADIRYSTFDVEILDDGCYLAHGGYFCRNKGQTQLILQQSHIVEHGFHSCRITVNKK